MIPAHKWQKVWNRSALSLAAALAVLLGPLPPHIVRMSRVVAHAHPPEALGQVHAVEVTRAADGQHLHVHAHLLLALRLLLLLLGAKAARFGYFFRNRKHMTVLVHFEAVSHAQVDAVPVVYYGTTCCAAIFLATPSPKERELEDYYRIHRNWVWNSIASNNKIYRCNSEVQDKNDIWRVFWEGFRLFHISLCRRNAYSLRSYFSIKSMQDCTFQHGMTIIIFKFKRLVGCGQKNNVQIHSYNGFLHNNYDIKNNNWTLRNWLPSLTKDACRTCPQRPASEAVCLSPAPRIERAWGRLGPGTAPCDRRTESTPALAPAPSQYFHSIDMQSLLHWLPRTLRSPGAGGCQGRSSDLGRALHSVTGIYVNYERTVCGDKSERIGRGKNVCWLKRIEHVVLKSEAGCGVAVQVQLDTRSFHHH